MLAGDGDQLRLDLHVDHRRQRRALSLRPLDDLQRAAGGDPPLYCILCTVCSVLCTLYCLLRLAVPHMGLATQDIPPTTYHPT